MKVDVILGLQWGDEGKGKIVDVLTPAYDIIARFQGGPNAGHTIEFEGQKFVLHTIPSGIFHKQTINVIGNGVVIDPVILFKELNKVWAFDKDAHKNLFISNRAHLILPVHRLLDACLEQNKGLAKIGSTLKGIAPAYSDKYSRNGIRTGDLLKDDFFIKVEKLTNEHIKFIELFNFDINQQTIDGYSFDDYQRIWKEAAEKLKSFKIIDSEVLINRSLNEGKKVLAEGAQGTLLDIDFGAYPFVTSSNTICAGACTGLGIPPQRIGKVYGIFKAYCTRVGSGPFPTELFDETGTLLQKNGHEFGATTGRPRRCGWLDLHALAYAVMINGVTDLVMTKADVLSGFDKIKVCTGYQNVNQDSDAMPFDSSYNTADPFYHDLSGWKLPVNSIQAADEIPEQLTNYIKFIENHVKTPISFISLSPDRDQTFNLKNK